MATFTCSRKDLGKAVQVVHHMYNHVIHVDALLITTGGYCGSHMDLGRAFADLGSVLQLGLPLWTPA
jgi:hypothetical protein